MLSDEQRKFIINQAKTESGQEWKNILKAIVEELYSSRGVAIEDIKSRQIAAQIIEERLVKTTELGEQDLIPQKNNEYI